MMVCKACPWSRKCWPGALGGSPPGVYVGQVGGPFWLPCHESNNYAGKASDVNAVRECAGAATFRANIGRKVLPSGLLLLPADKDVCFATLAEFYAHHAGISVEQAEQLLTDEKVAELARKQLNDAHVRMQLKERKEAHHGT